MKFLRKKETLQMPQSCTSKLSDEQIIEAALPVEGSFTEFDTTNDADNDMARDLSVRIGKAISEWRRKYHLEGLPADIILDQVIDIIKAIKGSF